MTAIAINFQDFIQVQNHQPVTNSNFIAKAFKKQHKDVLRRIDELLADIPADDAETRQNFKLVEKETKSNLGNGTVKTRAYELTKDGFMLLVMGFTGKQALAIKIAYIKAFNVMADTVQVLAGKSGKKAITDKTKTSKLGCLTLEQQDEIKKFHRELVQSAPKNKQAALAIGLWSAVKTKFGVGYKDVPEVHYPEVLSLMARVAVEKGALSGEVLDKEPELPVAALNDYELTRIAQFLSQSYSMMTELYIVQEPMNMLRLPFGQKALQYLKDNLPLLQAVVHGLQRFRPTDPICAPEFNKHMQYLSLAGLPV